MLGGEPKTIFGCTVVRFDETGLVGEARDYSRVEDGHHPVPSIFERHRLT